MVSFKAVVPARYGSTRLPAKPLADIGGKPMVVRVADRARESGADEVWVATDHPAVVEAVAEAGHRAVLTRTDHPPGTDRIADVAQALQWPDDAIVANVQGDEPLLDPDLIRGVAMQLGARPGADIATACHPIADARSLFDPNVVKVVTDREGYALYFSRAPIPFARDAFARTRDALPPGMGAMRHIGLYAYRVRFLRRFSQLSPAPPEELEALEQLRALWHGHKISVLTTDRAPPSGVDTAEDLERIRQAVLESSRQKPV